MKTIQGTKGALFICYSDMKGGVLIRKDDGHGLEEITIDADDIFEFAAEYVRMKKIGEIEDASFNQLLNIDEG